MPQRPSRDLCSEFLVTYVSMAVSFTSMTFWYTRRLRRSMRCCWGKCSRRSMRQAWNYVPKRDFSKPFLLRTDASKQGLGAVLCQEQESGDVRVVAYGSRTLCKAEENYNTHELEFLALYWAVTKQFHHYLFSMSGPDSLCIRMSFTARRWTKMETSAGSCYALYSFAQSCVNFCTTTWVI